MKIVTFAAVLTIKFINMNKIFQTLIIAVIFCVFAVPSFASVQVANINNIATIDDEPKKEETSKSETESSVNKEAEKKDEATKSTETKSTETKSCCKKEKSSCKNK